MHEQLAGALLADTRAISVTSPSSRSVLRTRDDDDRRVVRNHVGLRQDQLFPLIVVRRSASMMAL